MSDEVKTETDYREQLRAQYKENYKTLRIRKDDYQRLKEFAFFNDLTMIDAISMAIEKLESKEDK